MARQDKLRVLWLGASGKAEFRTIPYTLDELHHQVGGYLEPLRLRNGLMALVDEEGWLKRTPDYNVFSSTLLVGVHGRENIAGDALIVRDDGEEFASLTAEDEVELRARLEQIGVAVK